MWKSIDEGKREAKYFKKTKSTEYFDMQPDPKKIESMKQYLKDVGFISRRFGLGY